MRNHAMFLAIVSIAFSASTACDDSTRPANPLELAQLCGRWSESYEEASQMPDHYGRIFRRDDSFEFPPSFYRMSYIFEADGRCAWLVLHPADAHYFENGTWAVDSRDPSIIDIYDEQGSLIPQLSFRIRVLSDRLLGLEPVVLELRSE